MTVCLSNTQLHLGIELSHLLLQMCHHEQLNIHSTAVRPQFSPPIKYEPHLDLICHQLLHEFCTTKILNALGVNVTKNINSWPHFKKMR
jgi:hypothetical protein